jgi:hypothetical protein
VNAVNHSPAVSGPVMFPRPSPPDMAMLESLPHQDYLELSAHVTAPREARRRIGKLLPDWSLSQFEISTSLIASELVTNAVASTTAILRAGDMPPVLLWLRGGPSIVAVLTWDAADAPPTPRDASDTDESGRGLAIVAALSAASGYYYPAGSAGKITWAIVNTP